MSRNSLILGAVTNLPLELLRPFLQSLRATGFDGRLCLVVGGYSLSELRELEALADEVRSVDGEYSQLSPFLLEPLRRVRRTRGLRRHVYPRLFRLATHLRWGGGSCDWCRRLEYHLEGLQSLRYGHYIEILEAAPDVDYVMLTDVRDVCFQGDPFTDSLPSLEVALEDESVRIGDDAFNTRWLTELFGGAFVERFRGGAIACSGTTLGPRDEMLSYLHQMASEISLYRRPLGPRDQGVHNALVLTGRLPNARLVPNERGRVLTLGAMKRLRISAEGFAVNADGTIPPVLHQWDRHGDFVSRLRAFDFLRVHVT